MNLPPPLASGHHGHKRHATCHVGSAARWKRSRNDECKDGSDVDGNVRLGVEIDDRIDNHQARWSLVDRVPDGDRLVAVLNVVVTCIETVFRGVSIWVLRQLGEKLGEGHLHGGLCQRMIGENTGDIVVRGFCSNDPVR